MHKGLGRERTKMLTLNLSIYMLLYKAKCKARCESLYQDEAKETKCPTLPSLLGRHENAEGVKHIKRGEASRMMR